MEGARQLAVVVSVDVLAAEAKGNPALMVRSHARQTMLEHILAELQGDDEGSRVGDLIEMIRGELVLTP